MKRSLVLPVIACVAALTFTGCTSSGAVNPAQTSASSTASVAPNIVGDSTGTITSTGRDDTNDPYFKHAFDSLKRQGYPATKVIYHNSGDLIGGPTDWVSLDYGCITVQLSVSPVNVKNLAGDWNVYGGNGEPSTTGQLADYYKACRP